MIPSSFAASSPPSTAITFSYLLFFKKEPALLKNAVDCDKMKDNAVFRQRKEGDRIALAHQSGSRPLKKLWNEAKTPQQQRWRSAVLSDSDGVVWVEGVISSPLS